MASTLPHSDVISILSWNLDGLDPKFLKERTTYITNFLKRNKLDIIFLQEIVSSSYEILLNDLADEFAITNKPNNANYFPTTLVNKRVLHGVRNTTEIYENSIMGRSLLVTEATFHGLNKDSEIKFTLMNTHLESLFQFSKQRVEQLSLCFDKMLTTDKKSNVIFGGDLNLDGSEDVSSLIPESVSDSWIKCGSERNTEYSWDLTINTNKEPWPNYNPKYRFDRIYYRHDSEACLTAIRFQLCGKEKVESIGSSLVTISESLSTLMLQKEENVDNLCHLSISAGS